MFFSFKKNLYRIKSINLQVYLCFFFIPAFLKLFLKECRYWCPSLHFQPALIKPLLCATQCGGVLEQHSGHDKVAVLMRLLLGMGADDKHLNMNA